MPIRSLTGLSVGTVAALLWASALAADPEALLDGTSTNCIECDLSARDLLGDAKRADLSGADLTDALLYEADLANDILTDAQIEGAKFDAAIMPDGKRAE
jgi:uncharacterized protein YjbI with pentapeptide repeats